MLNEIVSAVAKKANLSEATARTAVEAVLSTLKNKLPGSLGSSLDSLLGGSGASHGSAKDADGGGLLGGLGNIAEKVEDFLGKK